MSDLFTDSTADTTDSPPQLSGDTLAVAQAFALLWTWRPRSKCIELLRNLGSKPAIGRVFTQDAVKVAQEELKRTGLLIEHPQV